MARGELRLLYSVAEADELLGIGRSTAYDLIARGSLPTVRLGRRVIVTRPTLTALFGVEPPLPHELDHGCCASSGHPEPAPPSPASARTSGPPARPEAAVMRVHLLTTVLLLTPSTTDGCTACAGSRCSRLGRWSA